MPTILSHNSTAAYRGRIAPSPTGLLHLGHARTFWTAQQRAREAGGTLLLRMEDIDGPRSRPKFVEAAIEDLTWFGLQWDEGPDCGGPVGSYVQSQRLESYRAALTRLREGGFAYPCSCSRKDIANALSAPHDDGDADGPVYPGTCRPPEVTSMEDDSDVPVTWRFRVPDGEKIRFVDNALGEQEFVCGRHFGDFPIWRKDDLPSYQLSVTVDDAAMGITEVVRGRDLLVSTARQLLVYRALGLEPPAFYHCELVIDETGARLAKRHAALSLRELREAGRSPVELRESW